jgi:uncharacterized protein YjbI with pentapeptide repeats
VTLTEAYLGGADLTEAVLYAADLTGASLRDANLTRANLTGADLTGAVWGLDQEVPEGWQRDTNSGRLKRVSANTGGVGN